MTINLEKELIRQNRKLVSAEELLEIKEYEKHASVVDNDALQRVGLVSTLVQGKQVKARVEKLITQTQKFNQERVFHVSQIKAMCDKYCLRFLPSALFKGSIDPDLALKITTFEAATGARCKSIVNYDRYGSDSSGNTFIMAPPSSFKLRERPKDPLFFYKINEEYYYLIHKWGNDLSRFRAILGFLSAPGSLLIVPLMIGLATLMVCYAKGGDWLVIAGISLGVAVVSCIPVFGIAERGSFLKGNDWDSNYID